MLDNDYIDLLFQKLSIEKRRELQTKLFGDTKQSMNYFRKVKDPGLSKLETLADFFDIPIDCLRRDSKFRRHPDLCISFPVELMDDELVKYASPYQKKAYEQYKIFKLALEKIKN